MCTSADADQSVPKHQSVTLKNDLASADSLVIQTAAKKAKFK